MTTYAKLLSKTSVDRNPPRSAVIGGAFVCGTLPASYLATLGYYPLRETPAPAPAEGCHVERRYAYDDAGAPTAVVESWIEVQNPPAPPRTFSKYKLKLAIAQAGLLSQFTALLAQVEVAPGYMGDEAFRDAVTLDEDNPKFAAAVVLVKQQFGLADAQIEAILAAAVVE